MADRTLYEILEVSPNASPETIRAAYERLSTKFDPGREENRSNSDARFQHDAVKEAFFTLGNPRKRAEYDKKLEARSRATFQNVEVVEPFWTLPKVAIVAIAIIAIGGYYYQQKNEEARFAAEKAIAVAKAREAEEKAKAEAEQSRTEALRLERERQERVAEERQRREREIALQRDQMQRGTQDRRDQWAGERERREQALKEQRAEAKRRAEETQAVNAAQRRAERERAELCRIERERYGKAISC
jgi:curved DNA-binding protein CbpA